MPVNEDFKNGCCSPTDALKASKIARFENMSSSVNESEIQGDGGYKDGKNDGEPLNRKRTSPGPWRPLLSISFVEQQIMLLCGEQ